jgi:hypothetical protein
MAMGLSAFIGRLKRSEVGRGRSGWFNRGGRSDWRLASLTGSKLLRIEELESRTLLSVGGGLTAVASAASLASLPPGVLTAAQVRHAYGFDNITFTNSNGTVYSGDGAGQTIAIVCAYNQPNIVSDLHNFDVAMGLPDPPQFVIINEDGYTDDLPDPDDSEERWGAEITLDVEWAHAMAPKASIVLVEADDGGSDLYEAIYTARCVTGASVISMTFGGPEDDWNDQDDVFTPSPEDQSDDLPAPSANVTFVAASGDEGVPGVYPAFSPYVLAVGGTVLGYDTTNSLYVSEIGWSDSGGGISQCASQPAYQKGVVTQSTSARTSPDVSFSATGFAIYDSYDYPSSPWTLVSGTSASAPCWAGLIAVANQGISLLGGQAPNSQTTISKLYQAYSVANASGMSSLAFHDITSGNNGSAAGVGYDLVTGLGTPHADVIAAALSGNVAQLGLLGTMSPSATAYGTKPTFEWSAVSGAAFYHLKVTDTDTGAVVLDVTVANMTSYTPSTSILTLGHSYSWKIQATGLLGAAANLPWGYSRSFTCKDCIPTLRSPWQDQPVTTTTPTFEWTSISGVAYYRLTVIDAQTDATVIGAQVTTNTYTPTTALTNLHGYYWTVQAFTIEGGTTIAHTPLSQSYFYVNIPSSSLTLVSPALGATVTTNTPTLRWSTVTGETDYLLSVFDVTAGKPVLKILLSWASSYTLTAPVASGHTYQWSVDTDYPNYIAASSQFTVSVPGVGAGSIDAPSLVGPSGLLTTSTPTLTWSSVPGAAGYALYVFTPTGLSLMAPVCLTGTSYTFPGSNLLSVYQYFVWWVTAYDTSGHVSATSSPLDIAMSVPSQWTGVCTPNGPSGTISTRTPTFQWSALVDPLFYYYYFALFDETSCSYVYYSYRLRTNSYTFGQSDGATLINNHTYRWYVCAQTMNDVGAATSQMFTVNVLAAPGAVAPSGAVTTTMPTFQWSAVSGAAGYRFYLDDQTAGTMPLCGLTVADTSYTPSVPLINGHSYAWYVRAYDDAGDVSLPSQALFLLVSATIGAPTLTAPSGTITTTVPTLQWSAVDGVAGYNLYLIDTTTNKNVINGLTVTGASYNVSQSLTDGDSYQWYVVAYDSSGNVGSAPSPLAFKIQIPVCAADVPVPISPSSAVTGTTPTLQWQASAGAAGYYVSVYDVSAGSSDFVVSPTRVTGTSYVVPVPLTMGDVYKWQVRAYDSSGLTTAYCKSVRFTAGASLSESGFSLGAASLHVGSATTVILTAFDSDGSRETSGGLTIVFDASGDGDGSFGPVTDNHNGTYTATFTAAKVGTATIAATIEGQSLASTQTLNVVPAPALNTSATSLTLPAATQGTAGDVASFTVSGSALDNGDSVRLSAPAGSEISLSGSSGFVSTCLLWPDSTGNLAATQVFVRISASATANVSGYLTVADALQSSLTRSIALSGVVRPLGVIISSVVVAEAGTTKNGKLESGEKLKITWAASSASGIASQTMTVDGKAITPISGPFSGLYYSCTIGTFSAGSHTYAIKSTDSKGVSSTSTGTFTVIGPPPPTISGVLVVEAAAPKNGTLESGEKLKITWAASSANGIASQTMTVDGKTITPISGPFSSLYYSCTIGAYSAGSHAYTIKSTDSKGVSSASTAAFTVVSPPPPTIASIVVAEAGTTKNGKLEVNEKLRITWAASSANAIASQTMTVDGKTITPISGPFSNLYYSCTIGAFSAGSHTYTIKTTDTKGVSASKSGTFTVATALAAADQRASLLAAVMQEMGQLHGYGDASDDELMDDVLPLSLG